MDINSHTLLLAFGLGLLGFIEPCTVGAHMLFIGSQKDRSTKRRLGAVAVFMLGRIAVMGGFGGAIVFFGQRLIGIQTSGWLAFGVAYLLLGLASLAGLDRMLRHKIRIAPESWRLAAHPIPQGLAFGLNVPACAAPILFGLMGTATAIGSPVGGFLLMAVFALALSLPLVPLSIMPGVARPLDRLAGWLRPRRWLLGAVFVGLGLWSIWFGLFVDPADWSRI